MTPTDELLEKRAKVVEELDSEEPGEFAWEELAEIDAELERRQLPGRNGLERLAAWLQSCGERASARQ